MKPPRPQQQKAAAAIGQGVNRIFQWMFLRVSDFVCALMHFRHIPRGPDATAFADGAGRNAKPSRPPPLYRPAGLST